MKILQEEILKNIPPEYDKEMFLHGDCKDWSVVVIDDDPTGCQTSSDVPVLFTWDTSLIIDLFRKHCHVFFILTNTRSMSATQAAEVTREVVTSIRQAAEKTARKYVIISRSDSTLRGHYPTEPEAIDACYGTDSMHCIIPAFFQGGRVTYNDVHYVKENEWFVPAGETPFAEDPSFGFTSSNLKDYVAEKYRQTIKPEDVLSFSIDDLRSKGPDYVRRVLLASSSKVCVVNALVQSDLDVFAAGAWEAVISGKSLIFRTAASFINSFGCLPLKELIDNNALRKDVSKGGLVIVGSHVPKSTNQLRKLIDHSTAIPLELHVEQLFTEKRLSIIASIVSRINQLIASNSNVVLYTSRKLFTADEKDGGLAVAQAVSDALVEIIRKIKHEPSFIITKGGITSHDIASKGLEMKSATVIGQALPGVPVLVPEENPGMKYIIFPGNVGEEEDLLKLYNMVK
ncbi:four-carbon acid sugar kinase family protein [Bacteroidota bacterium]